MERCFPRNLTVTVSIRVTSRSCRVAENDIALLHSMISQMRVICPVLLIAMSPVKYRERRQAQPRTTEILNPNRNLRASQRRTPQPYDSGLEICLSPAAQVTRVTAIAVLTLALAIGTNSAIFALLMA
jgi:hypothetical protein